jgi:hypothetical protein
VLPLTCLACSMMPKYVKHVEANPETLLTRFYGVHRVKPTHGRKVGDEERGWLGCLASWTVQRDSAEM